MTRKRLRKNAKSYGLKKREQVTSKASPARCKTEKSSDPSRRTSKPPEKLDEAIQNEKFGETLIGAESAAVTSESALCAGGNANRVKAHIRFRPVHSTVGREFNTHCDVWQPTMMDIGVSDNRIYPCGLTGLTNLGNTCYMNAAIQALSNCPPFSDFFRSLNSLAPFASKVLDDGEEPPVSRSFRRLLQSLWSEERNNYVSPQHFLTQIRYHCPQFRGWAQQDAQEFIRCLLDLFHSELRQPVFAWECRSTVRSYGRTEEILKSCGSLRGRSISSCSSSRTSDDEDRYETADSGWSSDGEIPAASKNERRLKIDDCGHLAQKTNHSADQQKPLEASNRNKQPKKPIYFRSLVTEVFDGRLLSVVKCLTCHHLSETCETFQDLSLSIPTREQLEHIASHAVTVDSEDEMTTGGQGTEVDGRGGGGSWQWPWWLGGGLFQSLYRYLFGDIISLNDALAAFFSPDDLRGENMYSCEKCSKLRNGVKICKIINCPEILCIHLKRFRHELSYSTKVRTTVTFPVHDLDLTPFIASSEVKDKPVLYDLVAFITHYGRSAESGHYVAYCKNEVDDNWYEFDDTVVTRLETPDILTKEAYVLFYQKQSTRNMDVIKNRVRQMLEEEFSEKTKMKAPLHYYISREWLHRFSTFAHPGPITNHDFLCQHSQILPRKAAHLAEHYATISSTLWNFLYDKFGGGPVSSELHYCLQCQNEYQMMKHKREMELKTFIALDGRLKKLKDDLPALTYGFYMPPNVIAKAWIDKWKAFVDGNEFEPPGPIDNNSILIRDNTNGAIHGLRHSQYMQLPREIWLFFESLYGGGPELLCIPENHPPTEKLQELISKVRQKIMEAFERLKEEDIGNIPSVKAETVETSGSDVLYADLNTNIVCS